MAKPAIKVSEKAVAAAAGNRTKILGAYKQMLAYQFGGTLLLAGSVTLVLLIMYLRGTTSPPLLPLVMLAGMLGAFFSALTRLYNVDQASAALITPTVQQLGGWSLLMYSLVPPVIGAIAAVVLYLLFVSKLVESPLFPAISCVDKMPCKDILQLMQNYWPTNPEDYGKALVWSFAAGFSERLVPDLLQSLVKKQQKGNSP